MHFVYNQNVQSFFLITQTFLQHYQSDTQVLFFFNNVNHKKFIETAKIQQTTLNFQLTHAQLSYKKKKKKNSCSTITSSK